MKTWPRKDCLGLRGVSREEIELVLDTARSMKEIQTRSVKKVPTLRGKIESDPRHPTRIKTIRDIGYRFEYNEDANHE